MTIHSSRPAAGVTQITINRPDRLNALNRDAVRTLTGLLGEITQDRGCRVVVLTGAGGAFCAGLDLSGYGDEDDPGYTGSALQLYERQQDIACLAVALHELRQPVIAAVNGAAAGGGLALALASDIRICVPEAVFAVSFIRAGYSACDIGTSWLLPRLVGTGRAHELMLTGRRCGADEAMRIGLVTSQASRVDLLDSALAKASEIMANPPFSVELTKSGMWTNVEAGSFRMGVEMENRQQIITALTEDAAEARRAFLEKDRPNYQRR